MTPSLTTIVIMSMVVAAGTFVQASLGFGLNVLVAPTALLLWPELVPGAAMVANLALSLAVTVRHRDSPDRRVVAWALAGSAPGTVAGAALLVLLDQRMLGIGAALTVLAAVALAARGLGLAVSRPTALVAGTMTAVLGTTTSVNGPPIALVMRSAPPASARATVALVGAVTAALSLAAILVVKPPEGPDQMALAAYLVPGGLAGWLLARRLDGRISRQALRRSTLVVSAAAALVLLWRSLLPL